MKRREYVVESLAQRISIKLLKKLGGPGSGHHGHAGRPGKRGGPAPSSGGASIGVSDGKEYEDLAFRDRKPGESEQSYESDKHKHNVDVQLKLVEDSDSLDFHRRVVWGEGRDDLSQEYKEIQEGIINWQSECHLDIGRFLSGEIEDDSQLSVYDSIDELREDISRLDLAFEKAPSLPYGVVVRRGLVSSSGLASLLLSRNPEDLVGKVLFCRSFISTSIDKDIADLFSQTSLSKGDKTVTFSIKVPAGEKFIVLANDELEILLNRDLRFEIEGCSIIPGEYEKYEYQLKVVREKPPDIKFSERVLALGGPGSGFHGHAGRPGKRGGSAPSSGISKLFSIVLKDRKTAESIISNELKASYYDLDCDLDSFLKSFEKLIEDVVDKLSREYFEGVSKITFDPPEGFKWLTSTEGMTSLGIYDVFRQSIHLNPVLLLPFYRDKAQKVFVHELGHHVTDNTGKIAKDLVSEKVNPSVDDTVFNDDVLHELHGFYLVSGPGSLNRLGLREYSFYSKDELAADVFMTWALGSESQKEALAEFLKVGSLDDLFAKSKAMKLADAVVKLPVKKLGGPGSGHHGHAGRPGKRGGSAPSSGMRISEKNVAEESQDMGAELVKQVPVFYGFSGIREFVEKIASAGVKFHTNLFPSNSTFINYLRYAGVDLSECMSEEMEVNGEYHQTLRACKIRGMLALDEALSEVNPDVSTGRYGVGDSIQVQWTRHSTDEGNFIDAFQTLSAEEQGVPIRSRRAKHGSSKFKDSATDTDWKMAKVAYESVKRRTQEFFESKGYDPEDEVLIFRGQGQGQFQGKDIKNGSYIKWEDIDLHPLSSWSFNPATAYSFADGGNGVVMVATIKVKDIINYSITGWGCINEEEVIAPCSKLRNMRVIYGRQ